METKAKGECVFEDVHIKQGDATKEDEGFKIVRNADSELRSKLKNLKKKCNQNLRGVGNESEQRATT